MSLSKTLFEGLIAPHSGSPQTLQAQLHWTLRVTVALCFIGHGTWGLITKSGWLPFFASQGIEPYIAWHMQRPIGALDIIMGLLLLKSPRRIIIIWMFLWGLWTAMLRPLAGNLEKFKLDGEWAVRLATDSMNVAKMQTWEFWERAGNWGPPFMLLVMAGGFALTKKDLFGKIPETELKTSTIDTIFFLCKACLALLLIGHAGFGFAVEKQMLIDHWVSIGVAADVNFIRLVGYGEFVLALLVFFTPIRPVIIFVLLWKLFTEFLYVPADTVTGMGFINVFEWIERWGDYGIPVAMLYILGYKDKAKAKV